MRKVHQHGVDDVTSIRTIWFMGFSMGLTFNSSWYEGGVFLIPVTDDLYDNLVLLLML